MVLLGHALYEVGDPVHPRLLCQTMYTVAHLFTSDTFEYLRPYGAGTQVVLHSIGSGNESVILTLPAPMALLSGPFSNAGAWTLDGGAAATAVQATDTSGNPQIQVWLYSEASVHMLYAFPMPLTDCVCRFGLPMPTLAFSPDNQYLVSGWPIGKGAVGLLIIRVSDRQVVATVNLSAYRAVWTPTGHTLYASGSSMAVWHWSPDQGLGFLANTPVWPYQAGISPDGTQVAYTAYADPANQANVRVYVFDILNQRTRMLLDSPRSEVTFVKDGWVWYREEVVCNDCPGGTQASDKVFALNLTGGSETPVVFAAGESPAELKSGWGPGEFYPNS
ncbi:MAG TPA: hypothetical protein VGV88_05460 [Candidatus Dormibacteraeota bacterium]|nr:hypothetical protein [Candidatus Dormibacteraeota bacterium]